MREFQVRSPIRIVHYDLDVKSWLENTPSVDAARPAECPCCEAAACPAGKQIVLHGHGLRSRLIRGPLRRRGRPVEIFIEIRRYRCRRCGAVVMVVPRGVVYRHLFSANAIGLALALWAVRRLTATEVRARISPWAKVGFRAAAGWASLRRWVRRAVRLWPTVRKWPQHWTLRQAAERVVSTLSAFAPGPGVDVMDNVFAGAGQAA